MSCASPSTGQIGELQRGMVTFTYMLLRLCDSAPVEQRRWIPGRVAL